MITGKCIECGCIYDVMACDFQCPRCSFTGIKLAHVKPEMMQVMTECGHCHHIYELKMDSQVPSLGCPECFSKDVVAAWKVKPPAVRRIEWTERSIEQVKALVESIREFEHRVQHDLFPQDPSKGPEWYPNPYTSSVDPDADEREERSYERREPFYAQQEGRGNRGGLRWLEELYALVCPRPYGEIYKCKP
jgi:DNA-directed RNA polymerase subunit RPC12/RpoP